VRHSSIPCDWFVRGTWNVEQAVSDTNMESSLFWPKNTSVYPGEQLIRISIILRIQPLTIMGGSADILSIMGPFITG
jgi:hypothetical protein